MSNVQITPRFRPTPHGQNIGDQCAGEDAYGYTGFLNPADAYYIIDMMHTNACDAMAEYVEDSPNYQAAERLSEMYSSFMDQLVKEFNIET